jgi:hypothetical protein
MLSFEKSFHLEFAQVAECTSKKVSGESSALYFDQPMAAPRNGTRLEENAKARTSRRRDLWLSTLSMLSLLAVLLMTACGPRGARLQSSEQSPNETAVVVLSGGSTPGDISGTVAEELDGSNLPIHPPADGQTDRQSDQGLHVLDRTDGGEVTSERLRTFAKEPAVSERVRLVMGWVEFFRNKSILPGMSEAWSQLRAAVPEEVGAAAISESESSPIREIPEKEIETAKVSKMEFRLWRELLRSSIQQQAELDRLALLIAAAERPEDLQDLDRWLMAK